MSDLLWTFAVMMEWLLFLLQVTISPEEYKKYQQRLQALIASFIKNRLGCVDILTVARSVRVVASLILLLCYLKIIADDITLYLNYTLVVAVVVVVVIIMDIFI